MRTRATTATAIALTGCLSGSVMAETLSFYGVPGLIDTPTAYALEDGNVALTVAGFGSTLRNTLTFQISPRLQGSFRYAYIAGFNQDGGDRFDRSFDLSYRLLDEGRITPAVSVGLRDFGGTGIYSSEYLVASKRIGPDVTVTGGLGWGRMAGRNAVGSPLGWIDGRFDTRPDAGEGGIATTGQLDFGLWFRGDVAPFGGISWAVNDKLTVMAEYSADLYTAEVAAGSHSVSSPLNFGAQYRFDNGVTLGAYALNGQHFGVSLSYILDPAKALVPGGAGAGPRPLLARSAIRGGDVTALLRAEGLTLENLAVTGTTARVRIQNDRYPAAAQALGRAARVLANALDPQVETFEITLLRLGAPISTTTLRRADLEELEFAPDNSWQSLARTRITDAGPLDRTGELAGLYPKAEFDVGGFFTPSLFDPDNPLRFETGLRLQASYSPAPGMVLSGEIRQPVYSTIDAATRRSNSVLPRVRSDGLLYYIESDLALQYLTAAHYGRPAPDVFSRVTVGYLEQMFGGVSGEVLWYPIGSRLALGAEVNYVAQRNFDGGLGFQDYEVLTGHASAYYDLGNGYRVQVDAGRYLAGDWGATVALDREFNNGVLIGAFFTLTDVPFEDFGEGSFDKGIRVSIPVSWLGAGPTQDRIGQVIRPVQRDGGARLDVGGRLYQLTRDQRGAEITDSWGLFWR